MGKLETNKKAKKNALLQNAFELFTSKGFAKTTIADIVERAGLAKGTFYLYFKDKYDLRDKLIAYKASQLFADAHEALLENPVEGFLNQMLFVTDYFIERFEKQHTLLQFIAKNLSWGIFKNAFPVLCPENPRHSSIIIWNLWSEKTSGVKIRKSCFSPLQSLSAPPATTVFF